MSNQPEVETITALGMARELAAIILPVVLQSMRRKVETGQIILRVRESSRKEITAQIQVHLSKKEWSLEDVRMLAALFCTLTYLGTYHD